MAKPSTKKRILSVLLTLCLTAGMLVLAPVQAQAQRQPATHNLDEPGELYVGLTLYTDDDFIGLGNGSVIEWICYRSFADYQNDTGSYSPGSISGPLPLGPLSFDPNTWPKDSPCYIVEVVSQPGSGSCYDLRLIKGPSPSVTFCLDVDHSTFAAEYVYTGSPCAGIVLKYKNADGTNAPYPEAEHPLQTEVIYESSDGAGYYASTLPTEIGKYKCTYLVARPAMTALNKVPVGSFVIDFLGDPDPGNAPPAFFQTETTSKYAPVSEPMLDSNGDLSGLSVERKNMECTYTCYFEIVAPAAAPAPDPGPGAPQTGDGTGMPLWAALGALALAGLAGLAGLALCGVALRRRFGRKTG